MSYAIDIRGVTKTFGPKTAVNNLDLRIPAGSLCGFIGPNGAGKTTTIRLIMSIIFADRGELSVLGKPSAFESKDRIGYLPEERGVYRKMRVASFLAYMARLKGVDSREAKKKVAYWLDRVGLADVAKKRCEELSKGMQQKVQFITAVIHEPDLLILDEVFSGLDPMNRKLMRELIEEQHAGGPERKTQRTIIFSTHAMYEAEQLCDRVFMIDRGVKVLDSTLDEIRARFDPRSVVVEPICSSNGSGGESRYGPDDLPASEAISLLRRVPGVRDVREYRNEWHADLSDGVESTRVMPELFRAIGSIGGARRVELKQVTLEDVFIGLVRAEGRELSAAELAQLSSETSSSGGRGGES